MPKSLRVFGLLLFCSVLCIGCDNEPLSEDIDLEETTPQPGEIVADELIGQWLIEDYSITSTSTVVEDGDELITVTNSEFVSGDQIITFTEDNQYSSEGQIVIEVTILENGVVIDQATETDDNFNSGTWSIDGNLLIANDSVNGESSITILSLNSQTLVLFIQEDNESLGIPEDDPLFGEVTIEGTITYSKVQ